MAELDAWKRLPDMEIIETVGMAQLPLIVQIFHEKYEGRVQLVDIGNDCMIRYGECNVANMSYLAAYLHFVKIRGNCLILVGNVSVPAVFWEICDWYPLVNGKRIPCRFFEAELDQRMGDKVYEVRRAFQTEINLEEFCDPNHPAEISFGMETSGIKSICGKLNSMRFVPVADCLQHQYAVRGDWLMEVQGGKLLIRFGAKMLRQKYEARFLKQIREELTGDKAGFICELRREYLIRRARKKKPVWLFFDRMDKADDNGEALFLYTAKKLEQDLDCYFVIGKDAPDYARVKACGQVVEALSKEHCLLHLLADYILTSQLNGYVENPFREYEEYVRDLYHQPKVIFLQHGVTKDDQTRWLNQLNQNLYAIVVSGEAEKNSFLQKPYFYHENQIWMTGMPRYDLLEGKGQKYLLFMPTWRKQVMEQRYDREAGVWRWVLKENFYESDYYKVYHDILNSPGLRHLCRLMGYRVIFMPHPIMQPYREEFGPHPWVRQYAYDVRWRELFGRSSLMVTDYSSVAFDFAYMEKPVLYFQFDKETFFQGHSYREGYFQYETMGFGEVVTGPKELVRRLFCYMVRGCRMPKRYRERVRRFFTYHDRENCRRIVERIREEEQRTDVSASALRI